MNAIDKFKRVFIISITIFISVICIFSVSIMYYNKVQSVLDSEIDIRLNEVSQHIKIMIENKINENIKSLNTIASVISTYDDFLGNDTMKLLNNECERYGYVRLSVITKDGKSYTSDGINNNVSENQYFINAMNGESSISNSMMSPDDGIESMMYYVPVYKEGTIMGVLSATYHTVTIQEIMSVDSFSGNGYSLIINNKGYTVIPSKNDYDGVGDFYNIFETFKRVVISSDITLEDLLSDLKTGKSGIISYSIDSVHKYINYTPLGINNWYLLLVVPSEVLNDRTSVLMESTLMVCTAIIVLFMLLIIYILKSKKSIKEIAFEDPITHYENWNSFLKSATNNLRDNKNTDYAIVSMDMNKFKLINDIYGYDKGNDILIFIANIIHRDLDKGEVFTRITADNFFLMLKYKKDDEIVNRMISIMNDINKYNLDGNNTYYLDVVFGIYRITDKDMSLSLMCDKADIARKNVKESQSRNYEFYDESSRYKMIREKEIENTMESALDKGEFHVFLQPKYELSNNTIAGAEALVRWVHPEKGIIPPDNFIPIFERNGFIIKLDYFMFEQVCAQIRRWLDEGQREITISVNLSRVHLREMNFIKRYKELVKEYNVPPHLIEIELTESLVFDNMDILADVILQLKEIGFSTSLDDFGTGYSSLNLLKEIPVDVLKLDREFFNKPKDENRSNTVVSGVIAMAKSLNIVTVSEGVEDKPQVEFLRKAGCDMVQGYVFAKPMPISEFEKLIRSIS